MLGALCVLTWEPHRFTPLEVDFLRSFAAHAAVAIEGARHRLLLQKRAFMADARAEVEPQRRRDFVKS